MYKEAVEKKTIITALPAKEFTEISPEQMEALKEYALKAVLEHEAEKQELEKEVEQKIAEELDLLTPEEIAELNKLLEPLLRTKEQWDRIQQIFDGMDFITATPVKRSDSKNDRLKEVDGILCYDDKLYVFTSLEKCKEYLIGLTDEHNGDQK